MTEGTIGTRHLNPKFSKIYFENEIDVMFPVAKILRSKSKEVILDLIYAKGFVWIKYEPGCFALDLSQELFEIFMKYKDGSLNSKSVKDTVIFDLKSVSEIYMANTIMSKQKQRPSSNLKFTILSFRVPKKVSLKRKLTHCMIAFSWLKILGTT